MAYYIDAENISLDDLRKRIEATDLIPSRASLLQGLQATMDALERQGVATLAQLRTGLKNTKRLEAVSKAAGIDAQYLTLLRREIESYFPKPFRLKAFDWFPKDEIAKLEKSGIHNTAALYAAASSDYARAELVKSTGVNVTVLESLARLADLTRIQWVSPTVARMLFEATYHSASQVAAANAEDLYEALVRVNEGDRFFKGKIGLRDVKRLIQAAWHVPG